MRLKIFKNYKELSFHAAEKIIELVKHNPDAVLSLAAGDTPRLTYNLMTKKALEEEINTDTPASIIRTHPNGLVMIDEEAASLLKQKNNLFFVESKKFG